MHLVIDAHNDLPWQLRIRGDVNLGRYNLLQYQKDLHTDIPRLRKGGISAQFFAAYVNVDSVKRGTALRDTLEQIDLIHRLVQKYPADLTFVTSPQEIRRVHRQKKIAILMGVEGGASIENNLAVLRIFFQLGVRYMTLTHNDNNDWADAATDAPKHEGLTDFGCEVVREMNRLGMIVDISHVSMATLGRVLQITSAPVIASHSCADTVAPHPRNITDPLLQRIARNGGVVMVTFASSLCHPEAARQSLIIYEVMKEIRARTSSYEEYRVEYNRYLQEHPLPRGTVSHVVDHIDYIVRLIGIDHVGLGSDFDGVTILPEGLEDVACYPNVTRELVRRGYSEKAICQILGENLLRVMAAVQRKAI